MNKILLSICAVILSATSYGQLAVQSFEGSTTDDWSYTLSTPACTNSSGNDIWDVVSSLSTIFPSDGSNFWGIRDLQGDCGGNLGETITFAELNTSNATNVTVTFDYNIIGYDNGDDLFYTLTLDGVDQAEVKVVDGGSNYSTGNWLTETISIDDAVATVGLKIRVKQNGSSDYAGIDNVTIDGLGSLPITMRDYGVVSLQNGNQLTWTTLSETNNAYFEVLHSTDAQNWTGLAILDGAGNSTEVNSYGYLHAMPTSEVNYYKIAQTDFDGTTTTTDVLVANSQTTANKVSYGPNPTNGNFSVQGLQDRTFEIVDINGRSIKRGDSANASVNLGSAPAGTYYLRIIGAEGVETHKVIKH